MNVWGGPDAGQKDQHLVTPPSAPAPRRNASRKGNAV
jgi:hypothetical protein